ncbi:MAG: outer membrane beta-barrel protein [Bacteroidota bacterium]
MLVLVTPQIMCLYRIIVALLFFSTALSAQVYEKSIGLELAPHQGNRRVTAGSGVTFTELERQDSLEMGRGGFSAGLVYDVRTDKIGFTTGIRYLETGYVVGQQPTTLDPNSTLTFSETVKAQYLSIPFELNFHQNITEKDRVLFTLGVAGHFHLNTNITQTNYDEGVETGSEVLPDDPTSSFRSPVFSINTGIGFDRKVSDNWSVRIQPNFQFFLQGNLKEDPNRTNRNFYQLGVRVVVRRFIY